MKNFLKKSVVTLALLLTIISIVPTPEGKTPPPPPDDGDENPPITIQWEEDEGKKDA